MQFAGSFAGLPGPDRKLASLAYPTSGIPIEPKSGGLHPPYVCCTDRALDLLSIGGCRASAASHPNDRLISPEWPRNKEIKLSILLFF